MPIPWPSSLLPEAAVAGLLAAVAGGAVGGFIGAALVQPAAVPAAARRAPRRARGRRGADGGGRLGAAALAPTGPAPRSVTLRDVPGAGGGRDGGRHDQGEPGVGAASDPEWLNVTAWQGGGSVLDPLERVGPGVYRTTQADPGARRLEGDGAPPAGRAAGVRADLPAAGPRHPGARGARARRASPASSGPITSSSSASARRACPASLTASAYATVLAIALSLMALHRLGADPAWIGRRSGIEPSAGSRARARTRADRHKENVLHVE